jgi:outer membrane protein assembly factor BamB
VHPLRTTLLLALAQIAGATAPAAPSLPSVPSLPVSPLLPSSIRWSVPISASPAAPPVIDGDQILIVLQSGVVSARKIIDGTPAWEVALQSQYPVAAQEGRVYVAATDQIVALSAADGTTAWSVPTPAVSAPLVVAGGWVIAATEHAIVALRSSDGSQVWTRALTGAEVEPAIEGDNLYVPLADGRLLALDLRTGEDRWTKTFVGPLSEVLAFPDRVFFGTGDRNFFCLHASDGEREWQRVRLGAVVRGRPAADDHHVYVTSMDNTLRAYRWTNGALLWHPPVPFRPTTGPTLIDSVVVVAGSAAELRAFAASNGQAAGQITLEEPLVMPPAFARSGDATVMSAFTGTLNGQWKLVLAGPPPPAPEVPRE